MEVFLSWSQPWSHDLAAEFRKWLPCVLQTLEPFMSDQDIDLGSRWNNTINSHLVSSNIGILFLTPQNINSPWLNFEAGSLSKSVEDNAHIIPLVFNNKNPQVLLSKSPLKQFQSVMKPDKEGIRNLVSILNELLENSLDSETLNETFEMWWPKLKENLAAVNDKYSSPSKNSPKENAYDEKLILADLSQKMDILMRSDRITYEQKIHTSIRAKSYLQRGLSMIMDYHQYTIDDAREADLSLLTDGIRLIQRAIQYMDRSVAHIKQINTNKI